MPDGKWNPKQIQNIQNASFGSASSQEIYPDSHATWQKPIAPPEFLGSFMAMAECS